MALVTTGHLTKAPACRVTGTRASRRSTAAIFHTATALLRRTEGTSHSRYPGGIGAALHPMLSKPLKAGPSSGPDGDHASWGEVTSLACRRRTLLRQLDVPRRRPRLSKAWRQYRVCRTAQERCELRCSRFVEGGGNANGFKAGVQQRFNTHGCRINTHRRHRRAGAAAP